MSFSIITASFNSANEIKECINSVSAQSLNDFEHIIADGKSTDGSLELFNNYSHLKVISEKDKGIYDALNKGIKKAKGDIVGILHSDDIFNDDNTLASIMEVFISTGADVVYGDLVYVSKNNLNTPIRYWKSKSFTDELLYKGWMPPHPTLFIKREVFEKFGYYDTNYKISADYDFILRIFKGGVKAIYLPKVITKMRLGGASNKNLKNILLKSKEDYMALRKNEVENPLKVLAHKNLSKLPQFFI